MLRIYPGPVSPRPTLVVSRSFQDHRKVGEPVSQAKIYEAQCVDELMLLCIDEGDVAWSNLLRTLEKISTSLATPLTVGGGIRDLDMAQELLDRGADKVSINRAAVLNPQVIDRLANLYGAQCVVASVDVARVQEQFWAVESSALPVGELMNAETWIRELVSRGAGEVHLTSVDRDGSGEGLDLRLIEAITSFLSVPLIASGGCGKIKDFADGFNAGASAIAAGTFFSQRDQNPLQCRAQLLNFGLKMRRTQGA